MANPYTFTPRRQAALRRAAMISAEKRRGRRRKVIVATGGVLAATGGLVAARHIVSGSHISVTNRKYSHLDVMPLYKGNKNGKPVLDYGSGRYSGPKFNYRRDYAAPGNIHVAEVNMMGRRVRASYVGYKLSQRADGKAGRRATRNHTFMAKQSYKAKVREARAFRRSVNQGLRTVPVTRRRGK